VQSDTIHKRKFEETDNISSGIGGGILRAVEETGWKTAESDLLQIDRTLKHQKKVGEV
jgi:hypothetical protein